MIIALGNVNRGPTDGREVLLVGLSRRNIELLTQGKPIRLTPEVHAGVPEDLEIVICFGETEEVLAAKLAQAGLVTKATKITGAPGL